MIKIDIDLADIVLFVFMTREVGTSCMLQHKKVSSRCAADCLRSLLSRVLHAVANHTDPFSSQFLLWITCMYVHTANAIIHVDTAIDIN